MIVKVEKREGIDGWKGYTYDCVKFFLENNFVYQIEAFKLISLPAVLLYENPQAYLRVSRSNMYKPGIPVNIESRTSAANGFLPLFQFAKAIVLSIYQATSRLSSLVR